MHAHTHTLKSGYKSRDESGEGSQGSRSKKHLKKITQRLQKSLPACHRGVVWARKEALGCAEGQKKKKEEKHLQTDTQYLLLHRYLPLEGRNTPPVNPTNLSMYVYERKGELESGRGLECMQNL